MRAEDDEKTAEGGAVPHEGEPVKMQLLVGVAAPGGDTAQPPQLVQNVPTAKAIGLCLVLLEELRRRQVEEMIHDRITAISQPTAAEMEAVLKSFSGGGGQIQPPGGARRRL